MKTKNLFLVFAMVLMVFAGCYDSTGAGGAGDSTGTVVRDATGKYSSNVRSAAVSRSVENGNAAKGYLDLVGDTQMAGGGIVVHICDVETAGSAPVTVDYESNTATFTTVAGKEYIAYLEFFIDGYNDTEIDGCFLVVPFTATENDDISFYFNSAGAGLFVNGVAHESNIIYQEVWRNTKGTTHEEREAWRISNYNEYGGEGYAVQFVLPE